MAGQMMRYFGGISEVNQSEAVFYPRILLFHFEV